jgi:hypothetical protein
MTTGSRQYGGVDRALGLEGAKHLRSRGEPLPDLFIDRGMTEQVPVAHAVTDPLAGLGKQQDVAGVCVAVQGAIHANKSVSAVLTRPVLNAPFQPRGSSFRLLVSAGVALR